MTNLDADKLLKLASEATSNAYAPYSKEPKGAALQAADGTVFTCGNLEFATYGGTVCAELGALSKAIDAGHREFTALALFPHRYPCGNCRQFFSEFGLGLTVLTRRQDNTVEQRPLPELLPNSFGKSNLD